MANEIKLDRLAGADFKKKLQQIKDGLSETEGNLNGAEGSAKSLQYASISSNILQTRTKLADTSKKLREFEQAYDEYVQEIERFDRESAQLLQNMPEMQKWTQDSGWTADPAAIMENLRTKIAGLDVAPVDFSANEGLEQSNTTQVNVTLPDGTIVIGYIVGGITYLADGSRPPDGAIVHATNGQSYKMGGTGDPLPQISILVNGTTVNGYIDDGHAYLYGTGEPIPIGGIAFVNGKAYIMEAGKTHGTELEANASVQKAGQNNWVAAYLIGGRTYTADGKFLDVGDKSKLASGAIWVMTKNGGEPYVPPSTTNNTLGLSNVNIDTQLPKGGIGYNSSGCSDSNPANHQWGTSQTIANIQALGVLWNELGYEDSYGKIKIGDISLQGGGYFKPHGSHQAGMDVDISTGHLTTEGKRKLIQAILDTGNVDVIFFNDVIMQKEFSGIVKPEDGHDNHLHVRYK